MQAAEGIQGTRAAEAKHAAKGKSGRARPNPTMSAKWVIWRGWGLSADEVVLPTEKGEEGSRSLSLADHGRRRYRTPLSAPEVAGLRAPPRRASPVCGGDWPAPLSSPRNGECEPGCISKNLTYMGRGDE